MRNLDINNILRRMSLDHLVRGSVLTDNHNIEILSLLILIQCVSICCNFILDINVLAQPSSFQHGYHYPSSQSLIHLASFDSDLFSRCSSTTRVLIDLLHTTLNRRPSLAGNIQEHGLDGMCCSLSTLPDREDTNAEDTAEQPKDADHNPACT